MTKELTATYDRDTKKNHRFKIDVGQSAFGVIYIPQNGEIPKKLTIELKIKNENGG